MLPFLFDNDFELTATQKMLQLWLKNIVRPNRIIGSFTDKDVFWI